MDPSEVDGFAGNKSEMTSSRVRGGSPSLAYELLARNVFSNTAPSVSVALAVKVASAPPV